jgi:hypothetical protein
MTLRDVIRRLLTGAGGDAPDRLPSRRTRREAARARHRADDEAPAWPASERHVNPDEGRPGSDLAPGTPGAGASRRWLGRRPR